MAGVVAAGDFFGASEDAAVVMVHQVGSRSRLLARRGREPAHRTGLAKLAIQDYREVCAFANNTLVSL